VIRDVQLQGAGAELHLEVPAIAERGGDRGEPSSGLVAGSVPAQAIRGSCRAACAQRLPPRRVETVDTAPRSR
jgi:hypothetical protein